MSEQYRMYSRPTRRELLAIGSSLLPGFWLPGQASAASPPLPIFRQNQGQFTTLEPRQTAPEFKLTRLQGGRVASSHYHGRTVLLNFWATWCPPCRWQLPTLERLAQNRDRRNLEILAVSVDREGAPIVQPYLKKLGIKHLEVFVDPHEAVAYSDAEKYGQVPFALYGMPISYLIDRKGVVVGYFPGAADWTSEAGQRLLEHVM